MTNKFPRPWQLQWDDQFPPRIIASNGRIVCMLSTGTFGDVDETIETLDLAREIMSGGTSTCGCNSAASTSCNYHAHLKRLEE